MMNWKDIYPVVRKVATPDKIKTLSPTKPSLLKFNQTLDMSEIKATKQTGSHNRQNLSNPVLEPYKIKSKDYIQ